MMALELSYSYSRTSHGTGCFLQMAEFPLCFSKYCFLYFDCGILRPTRDLPLVRCRYLSQYQLSNRKKKRVKAKILIGELTCFLNFRKVHKKIIVVVCTSTCILLMKKEVKCCLCSKTLNKIKVHNRLN